jgi:hypothetical protein
MATLKDTIKSWFETDDTPTQAQFWAWMDSFWHKDEKIPIDAIEDIEGILDAKADAEALTNHLDDEAAHTALFEAKENTENKGVADGYAPLNELAKIAAVYLNIVDDLTTGGSDALASAETVKQLKGLIDGINVLLGSDNVDLNSVQELVDAIETVQISLSTILINDLTTGGTTKALTAEQGKVLKALIDDFEVLPPTLQEVLDRVFGEDQRGQAVRGSASYLALLQEDIDGNVSSDFRMTNAAFTRFCYLNLSHNHAGLLTVYDDLVAEIKLLNGLLSLRQKVGLNETIVDFTTPIANTTIKLPAKPAGTYTLATMGDIPPGGGASSYKVWTALLSQSGSNNPTAIVQENTLITNPVITRVYTGYFEIELGTAVWHKIFVILTPTSAGTISSEIDGSIVRIRTQELNAAPYVNSDGILYNVPIEIRLYN